MERREFAVALGGAIIAVPFAAIPFVVDAQPSRPVPRVGFLDYASASSRHYLWATFRDRLRELGYEEGQSIGFEPRWADGQIDRLPALAADLVRLRVDLIATAGAPAALAAKEVTTTIPVVFMALAEAVRLGLVASLARPGGNLTGITTLSTEYSGKWVELLHEIIPAGAVGGVLWDERNPGSVLSATEVQGQARASGRPLRPLPVRGADEFDTTFAALARERLAGLIVVSSPMFFAERERLGELAARSRLPTVFTQREYIEAGGLVSYGSNLASGFRRAAEFVNRILKGARPGDLPVEQATMFELVINLKTARALGLKLPQSLLVRVDHVIE
jgi:putative tryptophan/tyrosine transport system substrate-binding protein